MAREVLFQRSGIKVYRNATDEIFVEDIATGATMRIGLYQGHGGGLSFTTDGIVEPHCVTNMIGWRVGNR